MNPNPYSEMTRDELLKAVEMFAKCWLAHDGCWFLAAEERHGIETAIELDAAAWSRFAAVEAHRIMETFAIPAEGGLDGLERALSRRMYAVLNQQRLEWTQDGNLRLYMDTCRVQAARRRKGLPDFPCTPVGTVEFTTFAHTVDPLIATRCLYCPPTSPEGCCCAWEFSLATGGRPPAPNPAP